MTKINDTSAICVRSISKGVYEITAVYNNSFKHRTYIGYTKVQATKKFTKALEKGEL